MPQVYVDKEDLLEALDTEELEEELRKRKGLKNVEAADPITKRDSMLSLDNASMQLRKIGRNDLAYRLDEIRFDYFQ